MCVTEDCLGEFVGAMESTCVCKLGDSSLSLSLLIKQACVCVYAAHQQRRAGTGFQRRGGGNIQGCMTENREGLRQGM